MSGNTSSDEAASIPSGTAFARLVYYESYDDVRAAIQRERNMKHWPRAWKCNLIGDMNPTWRDLYEELNGTPSVVDRGGRDKPGHDTPGMVEVTGTSPAMTS